MIGTINFEGAAKNPQVWRNKEITPIAKTIMDK
jgi:hypothetical protein